MNATRHWMIGCIVFASLSAVLAAWLAISSMSSSFSQYTGDLHGRFIRDQRDAMFRLVSKIEPPLTAEQIETAARASNLHFVKADNAIRINSIEFFLSDRSITGVRSTSF